MHPKLLDIVNPFVGLFLALVALFILVLIGVSTRIWIPVGIGIAVYISGVTWQFLKLWNEYIGIRSKYTNEEANRFNSIARYFWIGNGLMMLAMMVIFMFIRHVI